YAPRPVFALGLHSVRGTTSARGTRFLRPVPGRTLGAAPRVLGLYTGRCPCGWCRYPCLFGSVVLEPGRRWTPAVGRALGTYSTRFVRVLRGGRQGPGLGHR